MWKSFFHIVLPNTMYFASVNVLSEALSVHFDKINLPSLSYTLISAPSIVSVVSFSIILDAFKYNLVFPLLQASLVIGTLFNIIAIQVNSSALFLAGRFLYGVFGEATLTAQSQLIYQFLDKKYHSAAFAVCFCGYMAGESLAGIILPQLQIIYGYVVVLSFQTLSLLGILIYSLRSPKPVKSSFTELFKQVFQKVKLIPSAYFFLAFFRILYTASKSTYDSRSIVTLKYVYKSTTELSQKAQIIQSTVSAVCFIASGVAGFFNYGCEIFIIFGATISLVGYLFVYFIVGNPILPSVFIGVGFGMVAANCSALLVKKAGDGLASSALGTVFSLQYLISTGLIPGSQEIAKHNEKWNLLMYVILILIGLSVWSLEFFFIKKRNKKALITQGNVDELQQALTN